MRLAGTAAAAVVMAGGAAVAGGLDRSGQPIGALFESGNYAELSFGFVRPDVQGTVGGGAVGSGNVAQDYTQFGLAVKGDLNDRLSVAVILDQPYGAAVAYDDTDPGYPLAGTSATLTSQAVTGLLRYRLNDRFSIHGGLRLVSMEGEVDIPAGPYDAEFGRSTATGYVLGAAYEIPDIALRAALTWSSATDFAAPTTIMGSIPVADTAFTMPQQLTLDFQTGIAANTLLMAQVRWSEWTATNISPVGYPNLVSYTEDRISYSVGIGRRFSDAFSGAITVGYEADQGLLVSNLSPSDGLVSVQVGGTYTMGDVEISGGVRYAWLGDATTETIGADFAGNTALAVGLSIGYHF
ncbi:MAG: transporter [Rubellimicrobium sp.]|nr:transporter [Rubellimicrobium sp.]